MRCPACGLIVFNNKLRDFVVCPKHGEIPMFVMVDTQQMPGWEALIHIRASQILRVIRQQTAWAMTFGLDD